MLRKGLDFEPYYQILLTVPVKVAPYYEFEDYFREWIVYDELEDLTSAETYKHYCKIAEDRGLSPKTEGYQSELDSFSRLFGLYVRSLGGKSSNITSSGRGFRVFKNVFIKNSSKYRKLFDEAFEYHDGARLLSSDYMKLFRNGIRDDALSRKLVNYFKERGVSLLKSSYQNEGVSISYKYYPNYRLKT